MSEDLANFSMMELFRVEAETQIALLSEGLLALESDPGATESMEALMRAAHSLKGAARIVGLEVVVKLAHAMEDCFVAAQEGQCVLQPDQIDTLLRGVDRLKAIAGLPEADVTSWSTEKGPELEQLTTDIAGIKSGRPSATKAEPATPSPAPAVAVVSLSAAASPPTQPGPATAILKSDGSGKGVSPAPEMGDRVVRVGAENLNRLMELAAESLVEARRLKPFADSLLKLKVAQKQMEASLSQLRHDFDGVDADERVASHLRAVEGKAGVSRQMLNDRLEEFEGFLRRTSSLSDRLYQEVIASRMRPFGDGVAGFPRLVRDLARSLGKKVKFTILGKKTEVDRDILEKLESPLNHILRNALDHGLEPPAERRQKGKTEEGHLKLEARHAAGMLYITVSDDGRGVDVARLREKVVAQGMVSAESAANLSEAELFEFLFLPGFSTAERVTEISGRGVGLDVVQNMVQQVGGSVRMISPAGHGATFHLQLPITRSVIRALIVEIAGEPYAFPLPRIDRALKVNAGDLHYVEGRPYVSLDGKNVGLVPAFQVLELDQAPPRTELLSILVVSDRTNQYGLEIDRFLGERDLVVRPLDARFGKVPDVSSSSMLEDGSPILIIDVEDLVRSIESLLSGGRLAKARRDGQKTPARAKKHILVTDDSITVRELQRQLLTGQGYEVDTAVDGMEGWNAVRLGHYDLVISDVDMPRMTGIDFVKRIKSDERLKHLPVMIVSYKDREEDRLRGMEAGANYYLTKSSFQDDTFLNAVVDLIGQADA
ncbi:MAG: hybrid sensor histidine kinase/response regulator [Limisphaerales bacterium]